MKEMADPILVLNQLQENLNLGMPFEQCDLDSGYLTFYDEPNGGRRFAYAKVYQREAQALSIFGLDEKLLHGIICYGVGYAVNENHRGRGLAVEAVNFGLEKLKNQLRQEGVKSFYLEAVIDQKNHHSINVAKKLFPENGVPGIDGESGTPSLYFKKIIYI